MFHLPKTGFFGSKSENDRKKYNFFKTVFFCPKCFCGQVNCCFVKKSLEDWWKKNKKFTPKPRRNFSLNPKLMKKSMKSSEKSCLLKKFLWTTRKKCQWPCQKFFSQIQNFRLKSQNDEKSRKTCLSYFFLLSVSITLPKVFMWKVWKISPWSPKNMKKLRNLKNKSSNNSNGHEKAVLQSLQSIRRRNCKCLQLKGRKWWKKKFLTKKLYSLKTFL